MSDVGDSDSGHLESVKKVQEDPDIAAGGHRSSDRVTIVAELKTVSSLANNQLFVSLFQVLSSREYVTVTLGYAANIGDKFS